MSFQEEINTPDKVVCYFCGSCPKCVSSDGNSKDTVLVDTSYMVCEEKGRITRTQLVFLEYHHTLIELAY